MDPRKRRDVNAGTIEVGVNENLEVVINLDKDRTGHLVFSPRQARALSRLLAKHAAAADHEYKRVPEVK